MFYWTQKYTTKWQKTSCLGKIICLLATLEYDFPLPSSSSLWSIHYQKWCFHRKSATRLNMFHWVLQFKIKFTFCIFFFCLSEFWSGWKYKIVFFARLNFNSITWEISPRESKFFLKLHCFLLCWMLEPTIKGVRSSACWIRLTDVSITSCVLT